MTDANLPEENPYQSPQTESTSPEDTTHFGLTEPICVEGEKTVEHMLTALRVMQASGTWRSHVAAVLTMLACCYMVTQVGMMILYPSTLPALITGAVTGLLLIIIYVYYVAYHAPRKTRREYQQLIGNGKQEQFCFAEECLIYTDTDSRGEFRWEKFSMYREDEEILLLYLDEAQDVMVIPRSFCPQRDLWYTILELMACKLPYWEKGTTPQPLLHYDDVTPAVVTEMEETDEHTLLAAGHINPRDVRQATRLMNRYWLLSYVKAIALWALVLGWTIYAWNRDHSLSAAFPAALGLIVLVALLAASRWNTYRAWRDRRGPFEWQSWRITSDQLHMVTSTTNQTLRWSIFRRALVRERFVLLELKNRTYLLVARSFFESSAQWQQFVAWAREKIPA